MEFRAFAQGDGVAEVLAEAVHRVVLVAASVAASVAAAADSRAAAHREDGSEATIMANSTFEFE